MKSGFTLIELSIVLVIIGLITGGVLVGRDLISAAGVRAQVTQIEKYNTAVNTFRGKYGYLPGDIPDPYATQFGFVTRGTNSGSGNGDGVLRGLATGGSVGCGFCGASGETVVFWADLSTAKLIGGSFTTASETTNPASAITGTSIGLYLPEAKVGGGNYINVWSGGTGIDWVGAIDVGNNGINYYSVSAVTQLGLGYGVYASAGLTVAQAYSIDKKIDDGLPQAGSVTADYLDRNSTSFTPIWAGSGGTTGSPYTTATSGSATTCFDNGNVAGVQKYSMTQSSGNGVNCALSFAFQ